MRKYVLCALAFLMIVTVTACGTEERENGKDGQNVGDTKANETDISVTEITPTNKIVELEKDFSAVCYDGDYGFDKFLSEGGASSDGEVIDFLSKNLLSGMKLGFLENLFGCSTVAVKDADGNSLFGRNFDWEHCEAMVVLSHPENGYASISTVNVDFISQGGLTGTALKKDEIKTLAALYAPLDGMNEKGLAVSVNMIQDSALIEQDTDKPDLTTTTAIRLLLNQAATVEEALALLGKYDMHSSMGMMVHFALADTTGKSVAVEYVDNEMVVTETPVLTNFYLAPGEKHGIGTSQSHTRYDMLMERLTKNKTMNEADVRDALSSVSKGNFDDSLSTEWSIVFNQTEGKATYYHRENYKDSYVFTIE